MPKPSFAAACCLAAWMPLPSALAQDMGSWFPMADPIDVIGVQGLGEEGPCGSSQGKNRVADEVQRLYARAERCAEYDGSRLYNPYKMWIRGHDPDAKMFRGGKAGEFETLGDYETVPNYFGYYGLDWWDGRYTDGYREAAAKAGQPREVQPTSRFARFGYEASPAEKGRGGRSAAGPSPRRDEASAPAPRRAAPEGACGAPVSDRIEAKLQTLFDDRGLCDRYRAEDYARFKAEVPPEQHYVVNYMAWSQDRTLYPADHAAALDGVIE